MRIVIDARESGTSTGRYVDKLIENLHQLKPKHEIIILAKTPRLDFMRQIAPKFKTVASDHKEFTFIGEQLGLARQLYRLKPDLVHFTMTQQPVLYFRKSLTTIHDLTTVRFSNPAKNAFVFKFKQAVYALVIRWVAHKSKAIIVPSKWVKFDVSKYAHVNPAKISVTYEAADKISAKPKPIEGLTAGKFLMYVGRATPHKNLKQLIAAYIKLHGQHPRLQLVLAGKKDSLYQKIDDWAISHDIKGIVFTDFVSDAELRWLYENCAAYVFPSLSEGFGLPGLEAMVQGAALVSSKASCLPEVYGDAAEYFDPHDLEDMVDHIDQVLSSSKLRQELIKKGATQAKKYSWAKTAEQTLDIYKQALSN